MRGRAGMTLVELLVALTVMGAALAAGYGAFMGVADQGGRALEGMRAVSADAAIRQALTDWLRGATASEDLAVGFGGLDRSRGDVSDDELTFMTTAPTPAGTPSAIVLSLQRDQSARARELIATIVGPGGQVVRMELLPAVAGLEIRYLSSLGERRWVEGWFSSSTLPAGVEITIAGESVPPLLRRPVRVAIGGAR